VGQEQAHDGDEEFAAFVLASRRRLCRVAYLVCGDWHRAEDIVQTALAQVYARWSRIRREDGPDRYAHRAVVNAAIDEGRRPWRREHAAELLPERAAPADDGITLAVVEALAALPARRRAVVVLRYIEDLDVEQTAQLLGISTGTVKSQAAKGLAAMRVQLSGMTADAGKGEAA
jgi:RNA polymerase sigma-70 factor (sigma-E family)